jgi:hypothetical protein
MFNVQRERARGFPPAPFAVAWYKKQAAPADPDHSGGDRMIPLPARTDNNDTLVLQGRRHESREIRRRGCRKQTATVEWYRNVVNVVVWLQGFPRLITMAWSQSHLNGPHPSPHGARIVCFKAPLPRTLKEAVDSILWPPLRGDEDSGAFTREHEENVEKQERVAKQGRKDAVALIGMPNETQSVTRSGHISLLRQWPRPEETSALSGWGAGDAKRIHIIKVWPFGGP